MMGSVKNIVVIQSLQGERLTGKELYEDLIRRRIDLQGLNFTHAFYNVYTKSELIQLLEHFGNISSNYENGLVIHLEMHGDIDLKGLIVASGELIEWIELVNLFRVINIGTRNNLYITMATCNGRELYKGVDPDFKSPYAAYISASVVVDVDQVADVFYRLFDSLLDSGNLIQSYLEMERGGTDFYYKDSKTTFEDGFKITMDRLYGDENLKAKIVAEAKAMSEESAYIKVTQEFADMLFEKALRDIWKRHYDAFQF